MARPPKTYKRAGERHPLQVRVHKDTWIAFESWCKRHGMIPSDLIEEFMADTVAADRLPNTLIQPTNEEPQ